MLNTDKTDARHPNIDDTADNKMRRWKAGDFYVPFGISRTTFLYNFAKEMEHAGVLHRPGGTRFWWGRARDIDAWLAGAFMPVKTRGKRGAP